MVFLKNGDMAFSLVASRNTLAFKEQVGEMYVFIVNYFHQTWVYWPITGL